MSAFADKADITIIQVVMSAFELTDPLNQCGWRRSIQFRIWNLTDLSGGKSSASKAKPSGSIQNPKTGRKPRIPPQVSTTPAGDLIQTEDGCRSQRMAERRRRGSRSMSNSSRQSYRLAACGFTSCSTRHRSKSACVSSATRLERAYLFFMERSILKLAYCRCAAGSGASRPRANPALGSGCGGTRPGSQNFSINAPQRLQSHHNQPYQLECPQLVGMNFSIRGCDLPRGANDYRCQ
jgi:hypothetical protein